ncbi:glutathione peroxidase [Chengkuizengella sediminis]|uniref:glutathione peroxidase n=1 Tax=Chengkuizengella sediminis TaxID=1885917 RepID=UPI00138A412F|nr:glutathione peroxidase [Chengkuizengella sediminis]NDI35330.1 glutathione peroxidase [Chengkuizengella sediminis]
MSVYEYSVQTIKGEEKSLKDFEGKVILIVNTASKCGFTPQYKQLQELHESYSEKGLVVLGFPCNQFGDQEPGEESDIESFCELNYGVTFPMFAKVDVNGDDAHPLFTYLKKEAPGILGSKGIKWNFTKFLIDKSGKPVARYAPKTDPLEMKNEIEKLLSE